MDHPVNFPPPCGIVSRYFVSNDMMPICADDHLGAAREVGDKIAGEYGHDTTAKLSVIAIKHGVRDYIYEIHQYGHRVSSGGFKIAEVY